MWMRQLNKCAASPICTVGYICLSHLVLKRDTESAFNPSMMSWSQGLSCKEYKKCHGKLKILDKCNFQNAFCFVCLCALTTWFWHIWDSTSLVCAHFLLFVYYQEALMTLSDAREVHISNCGHFHLWQSSTKRQECVKISCLCKCKSVPDCIKGQLSSVIV